MSHPDNLVGSWRPAVPVPESQRYIGPLPDKLYRYRTISAASLNRILDFEVSEEGIFLAAANSLNDPDEGRLHLDFSGTHKQIRTFWKRELARLYQGQRLLDESLLRTESIVSHGFTVPPQIREGIVDQMAPYLRVACFSVLPLDPTMWAHYGKYVEVTCPDEPRNGSAVVCEVAGGGICLEYECSEEFRAMGMFPVTYSAIPPTIKILAAEEQAADQAKLSLCRKSLSWQHEMEWRLVQYLTPPTDPNTGFDPKWNLNARLRFEGLLKAVILGLKAPPWLLDRVRPALAKLGRPVAIKQVRRSETNGHLYISEM